MSPHFFAERHHGPERKEGTRYYGKLAFCGRLDTWGIVQRGLFVEQLTGRARNDRICYEVKFTAIGCIYSNRPLALISLRSIGWHVTFASSAYCRSVYDRW